MMDTCKYLLVRGINNNVKIHRNGKVVNFRQRWKWSWRAQRKAGDDFFRIRLMII